MFRDRELADFLLDQADARVRVVPLQKGERSKWHRHSELTEHVVALEPGLHLEQRDPSETRSLALGEVVEVRSDAPHRLVNTGSTRARYLLIQRGRYDFLEC